MFISLPSGLWRCWLGGRKGIQPVKTEWWGVAWLSLWSKMQTCIRPSWCHCHSLSLASVKSRLVLPFWYRLIRVVAEKGPLNGLCVCSCVYLCDKVTACDLTFAVSVTLLCTHATKSHDHMCDIGHRGQQWWVYTGQMLLINDTVKGVTVTQSTEVNEEKSPTVTTLSWYTNWFQRQVTTGLESRMTKQQ